ncbi:MAG: glycoside hydrolase family 127 protein [Bacteroidales bacterium]|nr:glycoside hydrolase family 127 protein [Bacteroidales bacterium]
MNRILSLLASAVIITGCVTASSEISTVSEYPTDVINVNYPVPGVPLQRQALVKLPVGSITPGGWLKAQLDAQKDGLNGHLGEISAWLQKEDNAWLTDGGSWGWEEVPYWLRGYASLAYIYEDAKMLDEAKLWIEAILASQLPDGNFGPSARNIRGNQDFWPNMLALWILQDYYEYSRDPRVLGFMTRYFEYQMSVPDENLFESYWENSRAGDNLWSVAWLYARTGDSRLVEFGEKVHRNTADWTKSTELPNWHNVNIAQCFREPATYYMFSGERAMLDATYNAYSLIRRAFGQMPGGMFGGDENSRIGFFDPRQGAETCGFAEQMASDEILMLITGNSQWAENCEDVAFNSYPAAFMPDMRSLRYITAPNQTVSDSENHAPGIDNNGPFLSMNPFSSRCCQHNHGFAWPYFSQYLVMATQDNGLAVELYSECEARAKVADGVDVNLKEETNYPFEEKIRFTISINDDVTFPLYLRIPSWCRNASIKVNGRKAIATLEAGCRARIERVWSDGDVVELNVPMEISTRSWQVNKNSVSVDYGPLTLSLQIGENYVRKDSRETAIHDSKWQKGADAAKWPSYDIYPTTPWNYALATDAPITVERGEWPKNNNPFTIENCPIRFKAKGRQVPSWGIDEYGLTGVLPYETAAKSETVEDITLIPMGSARLRISAFPTCTAK